MNIFFDAQPLLDTQKTGVAYCEKSLVLNIISNHNEDSFTLGFFSFMGKSARADMTGECLGENVKLKCCKWFPHRLYLLVTCVIPFPFRWLFGGEADVNHFFNYIVPPFVRGKTAVTIHDLTYKVFPKTMEWKNRFLLNIFAKRSIKRSDKIIAVSEFTKSEILRFYDVPSEKISVVYNAVDSGFYRDDFSCEEVDVVKRKYKIAGDYFLYLGTLEPRKNITRLTRAYRELINNHNDVPKLVIAGKKGWSFDEIFETAKAPELKDSVIFTDYVPPEDAPILMNGACVFCYLSLYEGYGMPVLEAMSCGTAVLASNRSSLPEVAGGCAMLVDPFSIGEICGGLEKLWLDTDFRNSLVTAGKKRAQALSWDIQAEKLHGIYEDMVKGSGT